MANLNKIGVVGAGTMGSGIALTALFADLRVTLYDISPEMLARAREYCEKYLTRKNKAENLQFLVTTQALEDLEGSDVVIEAAPEDLAIKHELFARLDEICPPPTILATNTSTLPVTSIASVVKQPERVAGMHFFNPAPILPLVEVVRAAQTSPDAIQTLLQLAKRLGKTPMVARDTPGFIVNRVARPFYSESLRLLGEGVATHEQIDRIAREGGGFRMGPFELMDLIGLDINLKAVQSVYEQNFYEPRFRPHLIQKQMVDQNALGKKTGRGFYDYREAPERRREKEQIPTTVGGPKSGTVLVASGNWAPGLNLLCEAAGYTVEALENASRLNLDTGEFVAGVITAGAAQGLRDRLGEMEKAVPENLPILCQSADTSVIEIATWMEHPERLTGFDGLFLHSGSIATLVPSPVLDEEVRIKIEGFFHNLERDAIWIEDSPALVLPRIVCMLVNEASFAVGEGVAEPETIDRAMQLGVNYPLGPLEWGKKIGYAQVIDVLEHLRTEFGEERYRVAPWLRKQERISRINGFDPSFL
jgi:3-hydroxybutyryl-CoA dehydrogenase